MAALAAKSKPVRAHPSIAAYENRRRIEGPVYDFVHMRMRQCRKDTASHVEFLIKSQC